MDGYDIFKKLIFGTSFDRLRIKRKRSKRRRKRSPSADGISKKHVNNATTIETDKEEKEEINDDYGDVELLTHDDADTYKPKKKKQKMMSVTKMAQIRQEEISHLRRVHHIKVEGSDVPEPIEKFETLQSEYKVHAHILSNIRMLGYETPTPVQMQVIPLLINDRQVLACAPTGSGKTASFLIPILHNLKAPKNGGIRSLILAPTRELAKQIYQDCVHLAEGTSLRPFFIEKAKSVLKKPKALTKCDILVATPNRLIYLLCQDPPIVSLGKVEWFIVDECDRLFEAGKKGFRDQLATLYKACDSAHVKRAMFSATFSHDVEEWCKMNLDSVVSVTIGIRNTAVETIKQELLFVGCDSGKMLALRDMVRKGMKFPVLIFVQTKERARELFKELIYSGIYVDAIHAERTQLQRDNVVRSFRLGKIWVLICTELMSRGIDFKGVNLVINYDFPPTAISYIHRIGRSGRAGREGHAITFFTEDDFQNLRSIAQVMINAGCEVPDYILKMKKRKKKIPLVPVKRESISTVPKYDIEKKSKRKKMIKKSREKKQSKEKQKS